MINKLVSVIIPIYDRTDLLKEAIESVLSQNYDDFEVLLIMDKSPEETRRVVFSYLHHPKVRVFETKENTGNACLPRNIGIFEAVGDYILFLDSDDLMAPGRIATSFATLQDYDVVYSDWFRLGHTTSDRGTTSQCNFDNMLNSNHLNQSTVGARREALVRAGGCKSIMKYCEDYELWLRMFYLGCSFKYLPTCLSYYRLHEGNLEKAVGDPKWIKVAREEYKNIPPRIELPEYLDLTL